MKTQLFVGSRKPDPALLNPVRNGDLLNKPFGGLWTSTFISEEKGSDWVQWCLAEVNF